MNTRQSGAHVEIIKKEEAAAAKWAKENKSTQPRHPAKYKNPTYNGDDPDVYIDDGYDDGIPVSNNRSYSYYDGMESQEGGNDDAATVYDRATRISSPRLVDDGSEIPTHIERKVVRQVEVPFTRQVKVPIKTRKIVPVKVKKKVKTTKLVEVPAFKMVDETYTEMVQQPAVRNKEIWVKKIVPEKYMETVPIKRSRKVKVPTTVIKEVDDYEIVEVSGSQAIEVDGYRVDDVEDTKIVEVEEYQQYKLRPEASGPARIENTRDIGYGNGSGGSRRVGAQVYHSNDERLRDVPLEGGMGGLSITGRPASANPYGRPGSAQRPQSAPAQRNYRAPARAPRPTPNQAPEPIGFKLSETENANCILVTAVTRKGVAEQAGVRKGDQIWYVNNRPTRNLQEFRQEAGNSVGNLKFSVKRTGGVKVTLTVVR